MTAGQRGFTLIEIMVALVVLMMGVIILSQSLNGAASAYSWLDERTRAYLVASDKLVEMQVYQQWPGTGTQDETVEREDERWRVRTRVSNGPYPGTRRVDIEVGPVPEFGQPAHTSHTLSSLLARPAEEG